jgi:nifR3 family TIM-barrel protein
MHPRIERPIKNFWQVLRRPFFALAPMADVTDNAFRSMLVRRGKPDVLWTEFVSADGLSSSGREHLLPILRYDETQRPIVAQIFGAKPATIREAARFVAGLGFDGIDINMGCPDRSVEKQGAGAALIKSPALAKEIITAALDGAGGIPVSVKTRIGYSAPDVDSWVGMLLESGIAALTIHARTRKELSLVPAQWEHVSHVAQLASGTGVVVIGNGDVASLDDGILLAKETGADGIMVGRGIFADPWVFSGGAERCKVGIRDRIEEALRHLERYERERGDRPLAPMKKHFKAYIHGFDHAKELRSAMMECDTREEIERTAQDFLTSLGE